MSDEVRDTILWTVACALIFYWFFAMTVRSFELPSSYIQKIKYEKTCRYSGGYRP